MHISFSDASQKRCIPFVAILTTLLAGCDECVLSPRKSRGEPQRGPLITPGGSPKAKTDTSRLDTVVARRLAIMPAVARWKWEHKLPIEDRDREAKLIADFVHRAEARGHDPAAARQLIEDQIDAAKAIQRDCFRRWNENPPQPDSLVLDLATQLRPRIDELTNQLLDAVVTSPTEAAGPRPRGSSPQ